MSRASEIEKALHAYQLANRIHNDSEAALHDAANAALALPPDPPGECCRMAREEGAEAMREACAMAADYATATDLVLSGDYYRRLPLPGAKEDDR